MPREELIDKMLEMLNSALADQSEGGGGVTANRGSLLVGPEAVVTSMALVSFITDVESTLFEAYGLELSLVSEQALSRKNSPFRTTETLADYILELAGASEAASRAKLSPARP
jgi:hypothetical protein